MSIGCFLGYVALACPFVGIAVLYFMVRENDRIEQTYEKVE